MGAAEICAEEYRRVAAQTSTPQRFIAYSRQDHRFPVRIHVVVSRCCVWVLLEWASVCKNTSLDRFRLIEEGYFTILDVSLVRI